MNRPMGVRAMRRIALGAGLGLLVMASSAVAAQYPPGPGNCCPDTLTIVNVQNPAANPHPGTGDVVLGIGGIVTGFANQFRPYGFYIQLQNAPPYGGVGVYTGNVDHGPGTDQDLHLGDQVVVYGKVKSYKNAVAVGSLGGFDEILGLSPDSPTSAEDLTVRLVSRGNALPAFHVGTFAELEMSQANPAARPLDGSLVRLNGPMKVVRLLKDVDDNDTDFLAAIPADPVPNPVAFMVVNPSCTGAVCDTVIVDCRTLTNIDPPPIGTILSSVQGVFDLKQQHHRIQIRSEDDLGLGSPPTALDAFPVYDNDQPGGGRVDSVMVVFDRAVDKTSAENVANYALGSGTIDGVHRPDAPSDDRVVLQIHNGLDDGPSESVTISNVKSLSDGTAMLAPQTFYFLNGVLELEKIRTPDPAKLNALSCEDRSRYSGPGSSPGLRASFTGTVTGKFGDDYTLQGTTLTRGGMWVHSPGFALTPGHAYILAGALQEESGETKGADLVYARDLGGAPAPVPMVQSIHVLLDETCDATQLFLNGADLDGMLVTLDRVLVVNSAPPGNSFFVETPSSAAAVAAARIRAGTTRMTVANEQIEIVALGGNFSFAATGGQVVTVTGVLGRSGDAYAVFPVGDADIHDFGPVPTFSVPLNVSKAATQSRDPDIVLGDDGALFMTWARIFHESVHSLSLDNTQNWSSPLPIMHQGIQPAVARTPSNKFGVLSVSPESLLFKQSTDGGHQMDAQATALDLNLARYPALTVGMGEHFHAAWERPEAGIYYSRSLDGGGTFSTPIAIGPNGDTDVNSMVRLGASTGDSVYAFWQYHLPGEPPVDKVMFSRSFDGGQTFSTPRRVRDEANALTSTVKLAFLGDAQVGPDGTVYVMGIQEGGPNDSVAFLRSTNGGNKFVLMGHPTAPALTGICPKSFAVGADGTIHALVATCGTALFYTRSTDGGVTWGPAVDVSSARTPTIGEPRGAKIILDGTGTPVIVWFADVDGSTEIFSSRLLN